MKFRLFALILAMSLVIWAQENPAASTPNAAPAPETKSCCHHAADAKDGMACCHHASTEAKDAMGCCGKDKCEIKDGKSCCGGKDMKASMKECKKNGACKEGKCCSGADHKSAMNCCGTKCEHHQQAAS